MASYTFINNGAKFNVNAPAGVTEAQAKAIFETQLKSGSLTNLPVGGELNAALQAAAGLTSALPFVSSKLQSVAQLTGVPVTSGISTANFLKEPQVTNAVGSLGTNQLQGLLAQTKKSTGQAPTTVSATTGIGSYGVTPEALERNGYLKPGTVKNYLNNPSQLQSVLNSPTVWTGKSGVASLSNFLSSPNTQNNVQTELINTSYSSLLQSGTVNSNTAAASLAPLLQISQKLGTTVAQAWSKGTAPASLIGTANDLAKQGQYALSFVNNKLPIGATGEAAAVGFNNTVNRNSVDQAVKSILNNNKIPLPNYTSDSVAELQSSLTSTNTPTSSGSTINYAELARQRQQAADNLDRARQNYERVLAENNNDRNAPAVKAAFAEFQAAIKALDAVG